jgi:predicted HAD superfamily phosphohydrolase YqeG
VSTTEITIDTLKETGASIIVLDYDGVLAPHGINELGPDIIDWLNHITSEFGEENIYILSNKPKTSRCDYLRTIHPNIRFMTGIRKKPFPDGLMAIRNVADCKISDIVILDDRLLTGGLATCIAGTKFIYIKKPLISLAHNCIAELFFIVLRSLERLFIRMAW